jgi:acetyl-CoA synthetase
MTVGPDERRRLLGLASYLPPPELSKGARFASAQDYQAFVDDTRRRPEVFWASFIETVRWRKAPDGVGRTGDWYPGGQLNLLETCLDAAGPASPMAPALCHVDFETGRTTSVSRAELTRRVDALEARIVDALHLTPGDRVFLAIPDAEAMIAAILACLRRGLTCVPQNPGYPRERLARRFEASACKAEIRGPAVPSASGGESRQLVLEPGWDQVEGKGLEPVAVSSMHPAFVVGDNSGQLFTLPTAGFLVQAISSYRHLLDGRGQGDLLWLQTPPHHTSLLAATIGALTDGGQVGVLPEVASDSAAGFLRVIDALRPRCLLSNWKRLLRVVTQAADAGKPATTHGPDVLILEGEMVEPRDYRFIHDGLFQGDTHVVQVISRPESGGFVAGSFPPVSSTRPSAVGSPAPGFDLLVVNTNMTDAELGRGGLLALRRAVPGLALELQRLDPPLALEVKARLDAAGHIWPMGEGKVPRQMSRPVAIRELEAALASLKGVEQVVVIRFQDEGGEERMTAFVKPEPGATVDLDAMRRHVEAEFTPDSMPDRFLIVRELPHSRLGKLLRGVLKRIAAGEPIHPEELASITDTEVVDDLIKQRRDR